MEYDSYNSLYHTPARFYNPQLHRFISEDPVFGTNLFSYAGGSAWTVPSAPVHSPQEQEAASVGRFLLPS